MVKHLSRHYKNYIYQFLMLFFLLLGLFLSRYINFWDIYGKYVYFEPTSGFGDLNLLLKGVDYYREGLDPLKIYYIPPYNYPSIWKYLSYISMFAEKNGSYIGFFLILSNLSLYIYLIGKIYNFKEFIYYLFILISPVSLLIFERGNSDLFVLLIIQINFVVFREKIKYYIIPIFISGLLKIFLISWITILLFTKDKKNIFLFFIIVLFFAIYLFINIDEIKIILERTPYDLNRLTFGFFEPYEILVKSKSFITKMLYFLVVLFTMIILLIKPYEILQREEINTSLDLKSIMFIISTANLAFTNLFAINWEYRLFFIILAIPFLLFKLRSSSNKLYFKGILFIILYVLYSQTFHKISNLLGMKIVFLINQFVIIYLLFNFCLISYKLLDIRYLKKVFCK